MDSLSTWLQGLGLERYARVFAENGVELDSLPLLDERDLGKLGVLLGHRRKLLKAAAELPGAAAPAVQAPPIQECRPAPAPVRGEGERRQLTVMFCDLVGSTALSARLDPEDFRDVVRAYQAACAEVIARFDGHIAQYLGDGLLVYFGYRQAHEDDAQRAVRAGLGIVEAVGQLQAGPDQTLAVRIGIHTGPVVVGQIGSGGRHEQVALGETPNVAARLQALAEPDRVVISAAAHRLVDGFFRFRDLGRQSLKGVSEPMRAFEVVEEGPARSRLDVAAPGGLTRLVGRDQEVALLLDRWERACEGHGQVVLLTGEPGIGKSRLVQVLKERVADAPHRRLEARGSPYYEHTPLYPITDLLPRVFEWSRDDAADAKLAKLERSLEEAGVGLAEAVPLLVSLLSLPGCDRDHYPLPPMSPERQRQKTLEALLGLLLAMATRGPVVFIVEDLHWVDPTTLEFLSLLLDQVPMARLLVVLTARPSFAMPWPARAHMTTLTLTRFTDRQTEALVVGVAGGKNLPAEVLQQIIVKTDGVPLFVEELTKMVLESGLLKETDTRLELTGPLPLLAIPSTLQDSLMARLDRLATVKEVAQLGATLGRVFTYDLLRAVSPLDEATLQRELGRLVEAELLYQRGVPPAATYTFKHALVQEAAYQSLLKSKRQQYHQRIAQAMVERSPSEAETRPEFVAHHYTEAGLAAEAIPYWQRAGEHAVQRSAHIEAVGHFLKALDVLATLPPSPERDALELGLQVALASAWTPTKGWAAPEVERVYTRARALSQHAPDSPLLFRAVRGQWTYYNVRGDRRTARELADQCVALAERAGESGSLVMAHSAHGIDAHARGDLLVARRELERSISLYDREAHPLHAFVLIQEPYLGSSSNLCFLLWQLGYPREALRRSTQTIQFARRLGHPFSLAHALGFDTTIRCFRREWPEGQHAVEALLALAEEQGFEYYTAVAHAFLGNALAHQAQPQQGRELIERALLKLRTMGVEYFIPYKLGMLAEAHRLCHQFAEAVVVLDEALALVEKNDERWWEAELHRLKGELLLPGSLTDEEQAEAELHRALEIARRQQAKSLELRAATSLARLWQCQGKRAEARALLAPIYGWFTEGFDTPDLKDAEALSTS